MHRRDGTTRAHRAAPADRPGRRAPASRPRLAAAAAAAAAAVLTACTPPEAERRRGGGAGADPGNHAAVVWMHGGSKIYHNTPCVSTLPECTGPGQASGFRTERVD